MIILINKDIILNMEETRIKPTKKQRGILNILLIFVFSFLVIFFALKNDAKAVFNTLKNAKWVFLVLAIFVQIMNPLLDGWVLMILIRRIKQEYTFKEAYINNLIGLLFCYITPSATGGQFAQISVFKKQKVDQVKSMGALIVDFLSYAIAGVVYGGITLFFNYNYMVNNLPSLTIFNRDWSFLTLAIVGFALYLVLGFGIIFLSYSRIVNKAAKWVIKILGKLKIVKNVDYRINQVDEKVSNFKNSISDIVKQPKIVVELLLIKIAKLSCNFIIPVLCCLAVGLNVTRDQIFIIFALTSYHQIITSFVPIPGSSGGSELFFIILFTPIFKENMSALTGTMLIWRFITFYLPLIYCTIVMIVFNKEARINLIDVIPEKHRYFFYNNLPNELEEINKNK